jgi:hypothetical protein
LISSSFQTTLIFPGAATQGQRDATLRPMANSELLELRAKDGTKIAAIFGKALQPDGQAFPDNIKRPTALYFYGNGACMAYSTDIFDHFRRMGVNVIIPDFEGYGMSGGKPSEAGCYAAADAAYDYLLTRDDVDPTHLIATGWSLGGAVAFDLASRRPIAGVATVSAFTNMAAMAHRTLPFLPTSLFLRHRFESLAKIRTLNCPIFLAHGMIDSLIPPKMCGELAAACRGTVIQYPVEGGDHNDVFDVGGEPLREALHHFFDSIKASAQN